MQKSPFQPFSQQKENIFNLNPKSKKIGKYLLLNTIGKGKFKVKKALDVNANASKIVALKLFKKNEQDQKQNYEMEKAAYSALKHKNTLKMLDSFEDFYYVNEQGSMKKYNVLVLEYASKGDLFGYIDQTKKFDEKMSRNLFSQMIEGVRHIHEAGYAHLDLKLENIYFDQDYQLKIADFDLSRPMDTKDFTPRKVGSINYMAPEILDMKPFNGIKVDIFSIGVILFCINSSKLPFVSAKATDPWYRCIKNQDYETFWALHAHRGINFSPNLKSLINMMLAFDPQKRPNINTIISSPWMKEEFLTPDEYLQEMEKRFCKLALQKSYF